jgi:hypothetical protein
MQSLDDWQIGLIYETAMNFPIDGLRQNYHNRKSSTENIDDDDLLDPDMGYSQEEVDMIKGKA